MSGGEAISLCTYTLHLERSFVGCPSSGGRRQHIFWNWFADQTSVGCSTAKDRDGIRSSATDFWSFPTIGSLCTSTLHIL